MAKTFLRRAGMVFFAMFFSLTPVLKVGATGNASEEVLKDKAESATWNDMNVGRTYCDAGAKALFVAICNGTGTNVQGSSARYIEITMHSGEYGSFAEGDPDNRSKTYFKTDPFNDYTTPVSNRPDYVFAGWSTKPEAIEVDVEVGLTKAADIGTDLYAVWSDKAYVFYHVYNGFWHGPDDEIYRDVLMEYDAGTNFQPLDPDPIASQNVYDFVGWNTQQFGRGERYTTSTVIDEFFTDIYSEWYYDASLIEDEMFVNEVYHVSAGVSIPVYKFTPNETATYEIYTDGIEDDGSDRQGMIRLQDIHDRSLQHEEQIDPSAGYADVHLYYEMQAGETYYIRFGEMEGAFISFDASIRKANMTTVTFNANHGEKAWFDGDHSVTTKQVQLPIGEDIGTYHVDGLENDSDITFVGWSEEVDPEEIHNHLLVTADMTVYAQYMELTVIPLDYNGGHDPYDGETTSYLAKFRAWDFFETPIDPVHDNPEKKFVGWSKNSAATEPDSEIMEGNSTANQVRDYLNGGTLYAVYGEPVTVTFNTIGGAYMMDDPSETSYEASVGKGHIFYGMAVMHDDPYVKAKGWMDQNGVFIPKVSEIYGHYTVEGDTTFTSVLVRELYAVGNGGYFPYGGIGGFENKTLPMPYTGWNTKFSYADAINELGQPVSHDASKYFIGFATTPDATEPDVIDGVTLIEDLRNVYAIWGDDEYVIQDESDTFWQRGDYDGLRVVVKRTGDDTQTYPSFTGVTLGEELLAEEYYDAEEGSLILTIHPDYLESLENGEQTMMLHFSGVNLEYNFTIEDAPVVPNTGVESMGEVQGDKSTVSLAGCITAGVVVALMGLLIIRRRKL